MIFAGSGAQDAPERVAIFVEGRNRPFDGRFLPSIAQMPVHVALGGTRPTHQSPDGGGEDPARFG